MANDVNAWDLYGRGMGTKFVIQPSEKTNPLRNEPSLYTVTESLQNHWTTLMQLAVYISNAKCPSKILISY